MQNFGYKSKNDEIGISERLSIQYNDYRQYWDGEGTGVQQSAIMKLSTIGGY